MSGQEDDKSCGFSLDTEFLKSQKGRILIAELILSFVVFICFAAYASSYLAAPLVEFIITIIFFIIISSRYHLRLTGLNWPCTDFLRCISAAVIILVVSVVAAARGAGDGAAITAALFGFLLVCVFCYDAFTIYKSETAGNSTETRDAE
ncbi:hypothetical protein GDO86_001561 [Hymenochirus boettgeri]|uniref:MARVEL domain-containing protein n=1 Tax=Hymenochirus boettgeri TaxID=247094 RepID=A0A8T2KF93_9PIPI|nr:hypothetical protein GDO86_001561 [Hymenochirus boettgeri]